jgi:hypothetical protein
MAANTGVALVVITLACAAILTVDAVLAHVADGDRNMASRRVI